MSGDHNGREKRPMNKKLPRIFQHNVRLYVLLLAASAVAIYFFGEYNRIIAGAQIAVLILLALYSRISTRKRTAKLLGYLESMTEGMDLTVRDTPLPVVVYNSQTNGIIWANSRFTMITGMRVPFFELAITDVVPDYSGDWLLDGKNECNDFVSVEDRKFRVYGSMARPGHEYIATTYWVDVTEQVRVSDEYLDSRPVFTILTLDNYDELLKGMREKEKNMLLSDIDEKIALWAGDVGGYLCKFDRDRHFFLFEERHLDAFVKDGFSVLDTVRAETGTDGVHATLSIGIGKDGKTPQENYRYANLGVEMALSRGGDQAVLRNRYGFEFFGGHEPKLENRTKVKSRIMANSFGELLADASAVFIMGHKPADFDSVGAAAGVCCIARAKSKAAHIVIDLNDHIAHPLIDMLSDAPEYEGIFISEQDAIIQADSKSLLVVVDTSRPDKVESNSLLLSCTRVAVIDHHRRAAEYIDNAVLSFHDPYASSSSELVAEMKQYLVDKADILRAEAEALLAGIVLDTKGFAINTGSGTFDVAAYLRRSGADAASVKRIMQTDIETAVSRYAIMQNAAIYRDGVALASSSEALSRVSIAQAADELLNITGVHTSFVAAKSGESVFVSGRSIGGVNVQLILETMGGGGSQSTAGLQIFGGDLGQVVEDLKKAIDKYFEKKQRVDNKESRR